jgi:hypothetical protein
MESFMAKKNRIPKKIAGFRVPKLLRKSRLMKGLLSTPFGRQIVADALVAAAAAAAAALVATTSEQAGDATKKLAGAGKDGAKRVKRAVKNAAGAMSEVITNAAREALGQDTDEVPDRKH